MRVLTTLHLNDIQKEVLAKTKAAPTPHVAFEEIAGKPDKIDDNFASARDSLVELGFLNQGDGTLEVTDQGLEVMRDENIIDEMGDFTEEGNELVAKDRGKDVGMDAIGADGDQPSMDMGAETGAPGADQLGGGFPMEGISLIRELQDRAKLLDLSTKA